jgi:hypothetical protein
MNHESLPLQLNRETLKVLTPASARMGAYLGTTTATTITTWLTKPGVCGPTQE